MIAARFALFAIVGALVGVGLAVTSAQVIPHTYQAAFTVSPAQTGSKSSPVSIDLPFADDLLGGLTGGGGGIARANYERFLATLSGRGLAEEIANSPDFMHRIFRTQWDATIQRWHPADGIIPALARWQRSLFGVKPWNPPGTDEVMRFLDSSLIVTPLRKGTFHQVAVVSSDAKLSLDLDRYVLARADGRLRESDLHNSAFNVRYLSEQLEHSPVAEIRGVISQDLATEILRGMQVRNPRLYTVEVFSAPTLETRPVFPNPLMMMLFGIIGGAIVGVVAAFLTARGIRPSMMRDEDSTGS